MTAYGKEEMEEHRKYERLAIKCSGLVALQGTELQAVDMHDLSLNGVCLHFRHIPKCREGDIVRLYFYYSGCGTLCSLKCKIARLFETEGKVCAGCHFDENQDSVKKVIDELIEHAS